MSLSAADRAFAQSKVGLPSPSAIWLEDAAETAVGGEVVVVVRTIGIVHRLSPAADVCVGDGLSDARRLHGLAEIVFEVRTVECLVCHERLSSHIVRHMY